MNTHDPGSGRERRLHGRDRKPEAREYEPLKFPAYAGVLSSLREEQSKAWNGSRHCEAGKGAKAGNWKEF